MSWEPVKHRIASITTKPAGISLKVPRGGTVPLCQVSFKFALAHQLNWRQKEPVALLLGAEEETGRLRLVRGGSPALARVRILNRGGLAVSLGHIPSLGVQERDKVGVDAWKVDEDTVEVILPDWDRAVPETQGRSPNTQSVDAARDTTLTHNGITLCLDEGSEAVSHGGDSVELTSRQVRVLALLAQHSPEPVSEGYIKEQLWGRQLPQNTSQVLQQVVRSLAEDLQEVGLVVGHERDRGYYVRKGS